MATQVQGIQHFDDGGRRRGILIRVAGVFVLVIVFWPLLGALHFDAAGWAFAAIWVAIFSPVLLLMRSDCQMAVAVDEPAQEVRLLGRSMLFQRRARTIAFSQIVSAGLAEADRPAHGALNLMIPMGAPKLLLKSGEEVMLSVQFYRSASPKMDARRETRSREIVETINQAVARRTPRFAASNDGRH